MSDESRPVFSLTRHRELIASSTQRAVERAVARERQNIASALDIQANTLGGVIGAALREVADQVRSGVAITTPHVVGAAARREDANADNAEYDPPLSVPFEALTPQQRQRRLARYAAELAEAQEKFRIDQQAEAERLARDAAARRAAIARGEDPDANLYDGLPDVQHTSDTDDARRAQRLLDVRPRTD